MHKIPQWKETHVGGKTFICKKTNQNYYNQTNSTLRVNSMQNLGKWIA